MEKAKWLIENLPEWSVIAPVGKGSRCHLEALILKVLTEYSLSDLGPRRCYASMLAPIGIGDTEETLGHHVEVEVHEQIVDVVNVEVGAIVPATQEAIFFGPPPRESNPVLSIVL